MLKFGKLQNLMNFVFPVSAPDCKVMVGQHIGWGVHYNPLTRDLPGFDCRAEQLVLCYVSMDTRIGHYQMMLQPAGGFYPVVVLYREGNLLQHGYSIQAKTYVNLSFFGMNLVSLHMT